MTFLDKNSLLDITIIEARDGSQSAARSLLTSASQFFQHGEQVPDNLANWLATAFDKIADGENANKALMLTKKRGRPRKLTDDDEDVIAKDVHDSSRTHKSYNKRNDDVGVFLLIAEEYGVSVTTVENIYYKFKAGFEAQEEIERENKLFQKS